MAVSTFGAQGVQLLNDPRNLGMAKYRDAFGRRVSNSRGKHIFDSFHTGHYNDSRVHVDVDATGHGKSTRTIHAS